MDFLRLLRYVCCLRMRKILSFEIPAYLEFLVYAPRGGFLLFSDSGLVPLFKPVMYQKWANKSKAEAAKKGLQAMCEDSWRWQSNNPNGYNTDK